jgi:hypothetical protein
VALAKGHRTSQKRFVFSFSVWLRLLFCTFVRRLASPFSPPWRTICCFILCTVESYLFFGVVRTDYEHIVTSCSFQRSNFKLKSMASVLTVVWRSSVLAFKLCVDFVLDIKHQSKANYIALNLLMLPCIECNSQQYPTGKTKKQDISRFKHLSKRNMKSVMFLLRPI